MIVRYQFFLNEQISLSFILASLQQTVCSASSPDQRGYRIRSCWEIALLTRATRRPCCAVYRHNLFVC